MPFHPSSAVSVASVLTAATVIVAGYRYGRGHSRWREVRESHRDARATRPYAWVPTAQFLVTLFLIFAALFVAAYDAAD